MHSPETLDNISQRVTTQIVDLQAEGALLIGRVWLPSVNGPSPVIIKNNNVYDLSHIAPTTSSLL